LHAIPTVGLTDSTSAGHAIEELNELTASHAHSQDFSSAIIMKDRFGFGGNNVHKIEKNYEKNITKIAQQHAKIQYVLQPFVKFDSGFSYQNFSGTTEIRLIYIGQSIAQTYIRVAPKNTFVCNKGIGGISIQKQEIPEQILKTGQKLARKLNKKHALYALDFVISNSNHVYLLEGNINPGIDWYPNFPENVKMNKKMIVKIVKELARRVHTSSELLPVKEYLYLPATVTHHPEPYTETN
jgi:glutathione synthase/RimK-type ligase-like ATP-grasp enzyme